eukprot:504766-Pelagomonas_calceolata.AAC.5
MQRLWRHHITIPSQIWMALMQRLWDVKSEHLPASRAKATRTNAQKVQEEYLSGESRPETKRTPKLACVALETKQRPKKRMLTSHTA